MPAPGTQEELDALNAAINAGIRTVSYGDRVVTYQSTEDMMKAAARLEAALAVPATGTSTGRSTWAQHSRD